MAGKKLSVIYLIISLILALILALSSGCAADGNGGAASEKETDMTYSSADEAEMTSTGNDPDDDLDRFLFVDDLPEEDLPKPDRTIKNLDDYIYALDYLAFYRIGDEVFFEIDDALKKEIYNPYTIHQKAYTMSDLADVYACNMNDSYYSEKGIVGIKYSMSRDIASQAPEKKSEAPVLPAFDRYHSLSDIPFEPGFKDAQKISCENSEQLYYLVMNGYYPIPEKGSIAETIYAEACKVLEENISGDMSDFQKIKAIYDWLTTEVKYDGETAYSQETYLVKEQAYYLEGVFLNRCAVCDGKAKAYALLLNLAGIPCYRTTGVNDGGDHAWNMVQLSGKWYISCSTYGQADLSDELGRIVPNYSTFLSGRNTAYEWYPAQKHKDIEELLEDEPYDYYGRMGEDDGISLKINNIDELKQLLDNAKEIYSGSDNSGNNEYKVEFLYSGNDKDGFIEEMTAYLDEAGNMNAAEVRCETGTAFQIMVLQDN